jgi:hypothetical protein
MAFPSLMTDLQRIASADQMVRQNELLAILREMDAPFIHYRDAVDKHRPENIVVSFHNGSDSRYVFGAHYDSVPGSTGTNDNGAAVSILLDIVRGFLTSPPPIPLDIAFFDLEERSMKGSQAYLNHVAAGHIPLMVNLDICGVGDTVVFAPSSYARDANLMAVYERLLSLSKYPARMVDLLPPGDDLSFEHAHIPSISVCVIPRNEVQILADAAVKLHAMEAPEVMPPIIETMHNGSRDSIDVIEESAMQIGYQWTMDFISALAK